PELPDQVGKPFEVRPAIDPPLSAATALARDRHVTELGEARERIVEGDDRVALRLVHLAEEEAGRELPPHLPGERILADGPFLLRRDRPRSDQVRLAEVLEQARGGSNDGMLRCRRVADHGARLAIVVEPAPDLRRERVTLRKR